MEPLPTAAEALDDLRVLLATPLATQPTRERLLGRAIAYLEAVTAVDRAFGPTPAQMAKMMADDGAMWDYVNRGQLPRVAEDPPSPHPPDDGRREDRPAR